MNEWNILNPEERTKSTLMLEGDGDTYRFYVDNRRVFSTTIATKPVHMVAIGTTVPANDYPSEAVCDFEDVSLSVAP